jgi:hypothetical protein
MGVPWSPSDLVGNSGRSWRKERSKHWRGSVPSVKKHPGLVTEQVKFGLTKLALGTRRGELGALRWSDCNFDSMSCSVQHSYYWRRGGHLKSTKTEALVAVEVAERIQETRGFRFPVTSPQREEAVGPCGCSQKGDPTRVLRKLASSAWPAYL